MFGGRAHRRSLAFARDDKGEGVTFIGSRLIEWTEKKLLVPASLRSHGRPGPVRLVPGPTGLDELSASRVRLAVDIWSGPTTSRYPIPGAPPWLGMGGEEISLAMLALLAGMPSVHACVGRS